MTALEISLGARRYRIIAAPHGEVRRDLEVQQWHRQNQAWVALPASSPRRHWAISRALMQFMQQRVAA